MTVLSITGSVSPSNSLTQIGININQVNDVGTGDITIGYREIAEGAAAGTMTREEILDPSSNPYTESAGGSAFQDIVHPDTLDPNKNYEIAAVRIGGGEDQDPTFQANSAATLAVNTFDGTVGNYCHDYDIAQLKYNLKTAVFAYKSDSPNNRAWPSSQGLVTYLDGNYTDHHQAGRAAFLPNDWINTATRDALYMGSIPSIPADGTPLTTNIGLKVYALNGKVAVGNSSDAQSGLTMIVKNDGVDRGKLFLKFAFNEDTNALYKDFALSPVDTSTATTGTTEWEYELATLTEPQMAARFSCSILVRKDLNVSDQYVIEYDTNVGITGTQLLDAELSVATGILFESLVAVAEGEYTRSYMGSSDDYPADWKTTIAAPQYALWEVGSELVSELDAPLFGGGVPLFNTYYVGQSSLVDDPVSFDISQGWIDADSFEIARLPTSGGFEFDGEVTLEGTPLVNMDYTFYVRAENEFGFSDWEPLHWVVTGAASSRTLWGLSLEYQEVVPAGVPANIFIKQAGFNGYQTTYANGVMLINDIADDGSASNYDAQFVNSQIINNKVAATLIRATIPAWEIIVDTDLG